jgi:lipoate-protein ligase A
MELFDQLQLWMDPVKRSGLEAMAVDEWLLETTEYPVLRVYQWQGDWASVGYFGKIVDARNLIREVNWVRRWTGGGIVDHRSDWTYTLAVPKSEELAKTRGSESYRWIHASLVEVLQSEAVTSRLSSGKEETGAALCFENPVSHDVVNAAGEKIAGAGQRRTIRGLLHQGSLALATDYAQSFKRASGFAGLISSSWESVEFEPDSEILAAKIAARYGTMAWLEKR